MFVTPDSPRGTNSMFRVIDANIRVIRLYFVWRAIVNDYCLSKCCSLAYIMELLRRKKKYCCAAARMDSHRGK